MHKIYHSGHKFAWVTEAPYQLVLKDELVNTWTHWNIRSKFLVLYSIHLEVNLSWLLNILWVQQMRSKLQIGVQHFENFTCRIHLFPYHNYQFVLAIDFFQWFIFITKRVIVWIYRRNFVILILLSSHLIYLAVGFPFVYIYIYIQLHV